MNIWLAATAEELQAEISPLQRFVKGVRHFDATFEVEGLVFPPKIYVMLDRGMSVLQLCRWKFSLNETLWQTSFN